MTTTECLTRNFGPLETVHRWQRMPEWNEFVIDGRKGHTVVSYKDAIYVFGGEKRWGVYNELLCFDVKKKSWEKFETSRPEARTYHSAVVNGSSMFVFGGSSGPDGSTYSEYKNDLFEYNFQTGQWTEWTSVGIYKPERRCAHGAAVYDNKLWIFGGYDANDKFNDMWTLSLLPSNKHWKKIEQKGEIPPNCCKFSVAVTRDSMFVFGGYTDSSATNDLFQFHFNERRWTRLSKTHQSLPAPRYGHTMVSFDRHLYVFGGTADGKIFLPNDLHYYDLDTQTWHSITPSLDSQIPPGRFFHAATVIEDGMFVCGGEIQSSDTYSNNIYSAEIYRFQFASYPECMWRDDFGRLLRDRLFCDVKFIVGPKETSIPAHAAVIEARSEFLRARIRQAREERELLLEELHDTGNILIKDILLLQVTLKDIAPEPFELALKYIYTDRIDPTEILIDKTEDLQNNLNFRLVTDVYHMAEKFNLKRLAHMCANYLKMSITQANVLEALRNAIEWNLYFLKEFCLSFIVEDGNYNVIVMSQQFETMDQPLMVEIIRRRLTPQVQPLTKSFL